MKLVKFPALLGLFVAALIGTLVLAGVSGAAATGVPLGTATEFAVLAGSGITNTGVTTIVGDSGSSPTSSQTGWAGCPGANCVTQTGANHVNPDPNDSATQSAKAALTSAYNVAAGQTPTIIPTELAGQSLAPGVYASVSGTFGMTGTLTLNAGGDSAAVYIFQTAEGTGTLITGSTGNVSLIGSTQSCNVFWKVGTSATLGAGSTFRGTIMAHTSISLGAAVTVDGRLLAGEQASGTGAVTLINDTIIKPTCTASTPTTTTTPATTGTTSTTTTATTPAATTPSAPTAAASTAAAAKKVAAARAAAASKTAATKKAAAARAATAKKTAAHQAALKKATAVKRAKTVARLKLTTTSSGSTSTTVARENAQPPVTSAGFTG